MDNSQSNPRLVQNLRMVSRGLAIGVIAIGALVTIGWLFDIESLKSMVPGLADMKFSTALTFMAAGIGLANLDKRRRVVQVAVLIDFLVGLLTSIQCFLGWN